MMGYSEGHTVTMDATQQESKTTDSDGVAQRFREARESMRELDAALDALGSPRKPERRVDRAPTPVPTIPIFNPTVLTY